MLPCTALHCTALHCAVHIVGIVIKNFIIEIWSFLNALGYIQRLVDLVDLGHLKRMRPLRSWQIFSFNFDPSPFLIGEYNCLCSERRGFGGCAAESRGQDLIRRTGDRGSGNPGTYRRSKWKFQTVCGSGSASFEASRIRHYLYGSGSFHH